VYASSNGYPFDTTLGTGGWLDLTQQGLLPCKTYKTSWRSFAKRYRIIELSWHTIPVIHSLQKKYSFYYLYLKKIGVCLGSSC